MPRWGAPSMKKCPPLDKGGLQGGLNAGTNPLRALRAGVAVVRSVANEHGTPTTPAAAVGRCIPSSAEEGIFKSSCVRHSGQAKREPESTGLRN